MSEHLKDQPENNYNQPNAASNTPRTIFYEKTIFHGNIELETELEIRGEHFGNIESKSLVIVSGVVEGDIKADEVKISTGSVNGNIKAYNHLEIEEESMITGDIDCGSLRSLGSVTGNINCSKGIQFLGRAKLFGNCTGKSLRVEDDVVLEGQIKIG